MAKTKKEIIATIAEDADISQVQAGKALASLIAQAYTGAKEDFTIPGLGKLTVADRKARTGRNPATGATIQIPAKKVLKFIFSKAAKDAVCG